MMIDQARIIDDDDHYAVKRYMKDKDLELTNNEF